MVQACIAAYRRTRHHTEIAAQEKRCAKCEQVKPASEFQKNRYAASGLHSWCKACCHDYVYEEPERRRRKLDYNYSRSKRPEIRERDRHRYHNDPKTRRRILIYMSTRYHSDAAYREQRRVWNSTYRRSQRGREKGALHAHRRRDRFRGLENTLTNEEWREILRKQQHRCLACHRRFDFQLKPTRDHIDPKKGLTKENCQALCQSCNSRKNAKYIDYRPLKQVSFLDGDG